MYLFPNPINTPSDCSWEKNITKKLTSKKPSKQKNTTTPFLQKIQQFHIRWSQNPLNYLRFFIHSTIFPKHKCQIAGAHEILLL